MFDDNKRLARTKWRCWVAIVFTGSAKNNFWKAKDKYGTDRKKTV